MGLFDNSTWKGTKRALPTIPHCGACGLHKRCQTPKMGVTGRGKHKVLFVGEAPGPTDDEQGVQFMGEGGDVLRDILGGIGVDIEDCWKTNAIICRPDKGEVTDAQVQHCRPNLTNTIKVLQPKVVILMGLAAVKALVGMEWGNGEGGVGTLERWVGWHVPSPTFNAWLCPTYPPGFVLRQRKDASLVRIVKDQIKAAMALEAVPCNPLDLATLQKKVRVITDKRESYQYILGLGTKRGVLAFDYETTGLKPERKEHKIYSVSFCLDGWDTASCYVNGDPQCMQALSLVLQNPNLVKIASNMKFEERWTRCKLGHQVTNWMWDTMLAAHCLDNRSNITSIKFQGYVQFGIGDYASDVKPYLTSAEDPNSMNTIQLAALRDLLMYGGIDSLLEYMVAMKQRTVLYGKRPQSVV